ncbi:aconitase X swivel domain-containing protein [Candidatus Leptofilum sp.]|uniref:aconitase X swivel domain-containing protein n=1 Tax=Candidatus Leptofilum sp. TaxID=3241576 RepID=UPI003B5C2729
MNHAIQFEAKTLVPGSGAGNALVLAEPLSLWGGLNPETGEIIDKRHPQAGEIVTNRILVLPSGRGSSSASSILLEAVKQGTAPAAIITSEIDGILALGAAVARELYDQSPPVLVLVSDDYVKIQTGQHLTVHEDGTIIIQANAAS